MGFTETDYLHLLVFPYAIEYRVDRSPESFHPGGYPRNLV
jgi:hypothetical protein